MTKTPSKHKKTVIVLPKKGGPAANFVLLITSLDMLRNFGGEQEEANLIAPVKPITAQFPNLSPWSTGCSASFSVCAACTDLNLERADNEMIG